MTESDRMCEYIETADTPMALTVDHAQKLYAKSGLPGGGLVGVSHG